MSEPQEASLTSADGWTGEGRRRPPLILVLDDDVLVQELVHANLTEHGYRVRTASHPRHALEILQSTHFDLVFSDFLMPDMDGIEFALQLREKYPYVPVVLSTGFGDIDLARRAMLEGVADFIPKPFRYEELIFIVERNIVRRQMEMRSLAESSDRVKLSAVQALAAAIDAKESATALHSRRVSEFAEMLGYRLGLGFTEVHRLKLAANLHDVGKISVPDSILNKPGRLDPDEWVLMKDHARKGAEILSRVPELSEVVDVVMHHHEQIDGKGYPAGLSGDDIPLHSRIIAVVDAYECMTSDRVYRSAMSRESAFEELRRGSGTQFDANVVEAFLAMHASNAASLQA